MAATPTGAPAGTPADAPAGEAGALWNRIAIVVLPLVAAVGAVLSWGSLYAAAAQALGPHAPAPYGVNLVGAAFPLLVDALILGASARYVAGVKAARPVGGWRLAAHAGVAGTVALNAAAAPRLADVPWHITAPIVWSVLVELVARDVLGELRAVDITTDRGRIPARLWLTAPAESVRISWRMARTGTRDPGTVRAVTERCAAAQDHLTATHPSPRHWRMRRQIARRLRAGVLDPAALAALIEAHPDPTGLHRAVLRAIAAPPVPDQATTRTVHSPSPIPSPVPARRTPTAGTDSAVTDSAAPAATPTPRGPATGPDPRVAADLDHVRQAVSNGQINGRVTKAKIREHLRCSNPHAGTINTLFQQHVAGELKAHNGFEKGREAEQTPASAQHESAETPMYVARR